jgi:hypothetical protein
MGKGLTSSHSPQRKPCPAMQSRINKANLSAGDRLGATMCGELRKRGCLKSPVRYLRPHAGIRAGRGQVTALSTATGSTDDQSCTWIG